MSKQKTKTQEVQGIEEREWTDKNKLKSKKDVKKDTSFKQ